MALQTMYITNQIDIAKIAEKSGVDWIFVDLEINGKEDRQGHLDTVISRHHISDVKKIKDCLTMSKLLVRVNPIFKGSKEEIDKVIVDGADIVMLPFFKTANEVEQFIHYVDKRAKVCLLYETAEAVEAIDEILSLKGIDYIHIGLNDLHLAYQKKFMFELLIDGTVEHLVKKFKEFKIPFGFGGVARLGTGELRAEMILGEHYRLGSSGVILSRAFCDLSKMNQSDNQGLEELFMTSVTEIRKYEKELEQKSNEYFADNYVQMEKIINKIKS